MESCIENDNADVDIDLDFDGRVKIGLLYSAVRYDVDVKGSGDEAAEDWGVASVLGFNICTG